MCSRSFALSGFARSGGQAGCTGVLHGGSPMSHVEYKNVYVPYYYLCNLHVGFEKEISRRNSHIESRKLDQTKVDRIEKKLIRCHMSVLKESLHIISIKIFYLKPRENFVTFTNHSEK